MPWTRKEKYFVPSFKTDAIHYNMIMIYYREKKLKKKRLHVLESDIITIKKKQQH